MMIRQYFRNSKGQPKGILVADLLRDSGKICFGWSVTHPRDNWNKALGETIAFNRLYKHNGESPLIVPEELTLDMTDFVLRAQKYFQTSTNVSVINGYLLSKKSHRDKKVK